MKNLLRLLLVLTVSAGLALAVIPRVGEIPVPEADLNIGGIGYLVAGYDIDGDGNKEIYLINDNWNDGASELIPRIYKLEHSPTSGEYEVVWSANAQDFSPAIIQNTWPVLAVTDLDKDGKMELVWAIVNFTNTENANPYRVWVYEHAGGDNFGIQNPVSGKWEPNSVWTITDEDNKNIRPISMKIFDIDNDGTDEILMASRASGMRIIIGSVTDIPDDGDGSETWTLEFSELDLDSYDGDNKWDVAVMNGNAYFFDEVVISKVSHDGTNYVYSSMSPLPGGVTFDAAQVADVDGDGVEEIIVGEYTYGDGSKHIWLLQEEGDTLKRTPLFEIANENYLNGGYLAGGAQGDIDIDENIDFIFGSRYSGPPNAMMFRVEYQGGDIDNSENWELTIADTADTSFAPGTSGLWNVIDIANMDAGPELEVVYTSSIPNAGVSFPIVVLDLGDYTGVPGILTPREFELGAAYPNPFNPTTVIPFTLNESARVTLSVFDVKGRNVATLFKAQTMEAGTHNVIFDGSGLSSGVYFYQLRVDNTMRVGKMVLNK
ncbi:MAG: FG-GAP-like repeat-containing protein [Candidatus Marinimicrobia bacterium]|nr:FG-GAP-like repeat-containing protein [Candidatus Neomarinimicrobiota bacterium]